MILDTDTSLTTLKQICRNFTEEIDQASHMKNTSLPFLINDLHPQFHIPPNTLFQIMVIGGTVCKTALVRFKDHHLEILELKELEKPRFLTNKSLLSFIAKNYNTEVQYLVINSAETIKPIIRQGRFDGRLISISKEQPLEGLLGKNIGEQVENYLKEQRHVEISVSVVHDAACLLYAGTKSFSKSTLVGGIVGTGINFTFFLDKDTMVNLESGEFDKFPLTPSLKAIDKVSEAPHTYLFEKTVAGGYLYQHFNFLVKKMKLPFNEINSTKELSTIAQSKDISLSSLAQQVLYSSASLTACQIASIASFKKSDCIFVMQGSLFWNGYHYKDSIENLIPQLVPQYKISFVNITNSDIIGAANLVQ